MLRELTHFMLKKNQ